MIGHLDLNVQERKSKSLFAWRGQFTPDLVDNILSATASDSTRVFDPFCGSASVIHASAKKKVKSATGLDVNPAAVMISKSTNYINVPHFQRSELLLDLEEDLEQLVKINGLAASILNLYKNPQYKDLVALLVCLSGGLETDILEYEDVKNALKKLSHSILNIPYNKNIHISVDQGDCRYTHLASCSQDLIFTSPPYINVFNYHQNHRKKIERYLGIEPLKIASSEIGANRKFRQNRFKTVVQYIKDMYLFCVESNRVLDNGGIVVIVIGRESKVMGIPFLNGKIIFDVFLKSGLFEEVSSREREFTNIFGSDIKEDIFVFRKSANELPVYDVFDIVDEHIRNAISISDQRTRFDLVEALDSYLDITPSPKLTLIV